LRVAFTPFSVSPKERAKRLKPARWAGLAKEPGCGRPSRQTGLFAKIAHRAIFKRSSLPLGEGKEGGIKNMK